MRTYNKLLGNFTAAWIIAVVSLCGSQGAVFTSESAGFSNTTDNDVAQDSDVRPHSDR